MYSKALQLVRTKPFRFVLIVFGLLILKELVFIQTFRGEVSPIADGYSEANTIRGGIYFHKFGITSHKGLPDINWGNLFPEGGSGARGEQAPSQAYTHYPPGPEYMAWLGFHLVGVGNFNFLRLIPLLLSVFVGYFFLRVNFDLVGGGSRGIIFCLLLILVPMYSNYMHGLHHQQYAFLMFQLQCALSILYLRHKRVWFLIMFLLLGFAQGYMTFDFAFLATLFVIPFWIFFESSLMTLLSVGLCSGIGFTAAHLLHFYQVVAYYGDFDEAIKDFTGSAAHRSHNAVSHVDVANPKYDPKSIGPVTVFKDYLYRVAGRGKYLAINLMNFIWIILALKFVKRVTLKRGWTFEFSITGRDFAAIAAATVISGMWSLVMKQHAHIHGFIARHYFFSYYFCCLVLVSRTKRVE